MFGGGTTTRELDADDPVRVPAIRGQLRFWWRCAFGSRYDTAKDMFEAESAIFGHDGSAGRVALSVRVDDRGREVSDTRDKKLSGRMPSYALFPFRPNLKDGVKVGPPRLGTQFTLNILPGHAARDEVATALRLWLAFGGLGARTRRGCGSLAVLESKGVPDAKLLTPDPGPDLVTMLPSHVYLGTSVQDALQAWSRAVDRYRHFRQGPGFARPPGKVPGRSYYPEPDTIRRLRRTWDKRHAPSKDSIDGYPRADLGLPINFEFKDSKSNCQGRGVTGSGPFDPEMQTLQACEPGARRFASPVITKAYATGHGYRPLVMILNSPHVWEKELELVEDQLKQHKIPKNQVKLTPAQLLGKPLNGKPARDALVEFLANRQFDKTSLKELTL